MTGIIKRAGGAFVVVFLLIVGVTAVGGVVLDSNPTPEPVADDHWQLDTVTPDGVDEGGTINMESTESSNTVVVHLGQGAGSGLGGTTPLLPIETTDQPAEADIGTLGGTERGVSPLTSTLVENGHEVTFYRGNPTGEPLPSLLADADAFVTTNPGSLSATDIDTVASFAEAGGRTLIASDPGTAGALTELGSTAGIYGEAGYVYDMTNNDANYLSVLVESSGSSVLTNDVDEVVFRGAARVGAASGSEPLTTAETAQLSTTREAGTYGVAVRSGSVAAVGDSSFLAPENAYHADNNVLIGNLGDFLVTGENPDVSFGPAGGAGPPGGAPTPPSGPTDPSGPSTPTDPPANETSSG
ncbi:glycosyltransferase family protein [Halorubrum lacusprofundi]|jgi:hypothetical protein|uniref:hypothetical protein n=1 Tax=Halorubrum lacusprofundi TaxID=2247 RepID=UPI000B5AB363|nr:hypothetical protein [Halorubrum lacusprofundi]MCG1008019.1 hypothetical protein [Halorubrum lacusprofundi]